MYSTKCLVGCSISATSPGGFRLTHLAWRILHRDSREVWSKLCGMRRKRQTKAISTKWNWKIEEKIMSITWTFRWCKYRIRYIVRELWKTFPAYHWEMYRFLQHTPEESRVKTIIPECQRKRIWKLWTFSETKTATIRIIPRGYFGLKRQA